MLPEHLPVAQVLEIIENHPQVPASPPGMPSPDQSSMPLPVPSACCWSPRDPWPPDEALREQDACARCAGSSAGAQAIFFQVHFFKKPETSSSAAWQQGCRLPALQDQTQQHLRTLQLVLKPPSPPSRMPCSISQLPAIPPRCILSSFFSGKAGKMPLEQVRTDRFGEGRWGPHCTPVPGSRPRQRPPGAKLLSFRQRT